MTDLERLPTQEQIRAVMARTEELEKAHTKAELVRKYRHLYPTTWTKHHPSTWRKEEIAKEVAMAELGITYPATVFEEPKVDDQRDFAEEDANRRAMQAENEAEAGPTPGLCLDETCLKYGFQHFGDHYYNASILGR